MQKKILHIPLSHAWPFSSDLSYISFSEISALFICSIFKWELKPSISVTTIRRSRVMLMIGIFQIRKTYHFGHQHIAHVRIVYET